MNLDSYNQSLENECYSKYEVLFNADDITFNSLLEQGFTFIDQQEDELYV